MVSVAGPRVGGEYRSILEHLIAAATDRDARTVGITMEAPDGLSEMGAREVETIAPGDDAEAAWSDGSG